MDIATKRLEELTIEEWGDLFPIEMVNYQANWSSVFQKEKELIEQQLSKKIVIDIQHIGSTAIPNLASKGSIDMLVDISEKHVFNDDIITLMENINYEYCRQPGYGQDYMIFVKGFNRKGEKEQKYYVHMTPKNHKEMWDRILFRDYLRAHPDTAKAYENLKIKLAAKFSKDKKSFTMGKTKFVTEITNKAKENTTNLNTF